MVAALVAFGSIAWLLRFVQSNKFTGFALYRIVVGIIIIVLLATGVLQPT